MGFVPKWSRGNHKKTAPSSAQQGVRQMPSLFHGAKDAQFSAPNLFADGGEVSEEALKSEGLKASQSENVGFFERMKMGNIDDPSSEAYKRFGAGRGRLERDRAMAEKQMDDLDSRKAAAPAKVETFPLPDNKVESDAEASQREGMRNAEMTRLMNQAKREARRPAAAPASKPVDYSTAPDESAAETARLVRMSKPAAVRPRPRMNFSTPADRARWDEKYKATHNEDGTPK